MLIRFLDEFNGDIAEVEQLLLHNRIFIDRCENVGYMSQQDVIGMGLTGPLLRASGVARDLRRDAPYLVYDDLDFDVITATESDVLARFMSDSERQRRARRSCARRSEKCRKVPLEQMMSKSCFPRRNARTQNGRADS